METVENQEMQEEKKQQAREMSAEELKAARRGFMFFGSKLPERRLKKN
jgi:hypothetical protein